MAAWLGQACKTEPGFVNCMLSLTMLDIHSFIKTDPLNQQSHNTTSVNKVWSLLSVPRTHKAQRLLREASTHEKGGLAKGCSPNSLEPAEAWHAPHMRKHTYRKTMRPPERQPIQALRQPYLRGVMQHIYTYIYIYEHETRRLGSEYACMVRVGLQNKTSFC